MDAASVSPVLEARQALERDAKPLAVVFVSLPDFRDERGLRRLPVQHPEYVAEIDLAFADLEALAVDAAGVGHVNMGDERADLFHELVERPAVLGACELGMRGVEADAHPELAAAARDVAA